MNTRPSSPLDSRLIQAMRSLRQDNEALSQQVQQLQAQISQALKQATEQELRNRHLDQQVVKQDKELGPLRLSQVQLQEALAQQGALRASESQLESRSRQQQEEIAQLRQTLHQRELEVQHWQQASLASSQELERIQHQARQVIVQHYQAMKSAQQQATQAWEELRRQRCQFEAQREQLETLRPSLLGRRKALPPRSLRGTPTRTPGAT